MDTLSIKCRSYASEKKVSRWLTDKLILSRITIFKHDYKTRKALQRLNDDQLKDIGITRKQAEVEYNKPFWQ